VVDRYRSMLVTDAAAIASLPPVGEPTLRRFRVGLVCLLYAGLLSVAMMGHGVFRVVLIVISVAAGWALQSAYRLEHSILETPDTALGTILECVKTRRRNSARIKYGFQAADGRVYLGRFNGSIGWLKKKSQTIPIFYKLNDPEVSLPASRFFFYRIY